MRHAEGDDEAQAQTRPGAALSGSERADTKERETRLELATFSLEG